MGVRYPPGGRGEHLLASDPVVSIGPDHRAYLASLAIPHDTRNGDVVVSTSADLGRTWAAPAVVRTGNVVTVIPLTSPSDSGVAPSGNGIFFGTGSSEQAAPTGVWSFQALG